MPTACFWPFFEFSTFLYRCLVSLELSGRTPILPVNDPDASSGAAATSGIKLFVVVPGPVGKITVAFANGPAARPV
eukprot:7289735-Lingulodinium_polyedra.AAC.1